MKRERLQEDVPKEDSRELSPAARHSWTLKAARAWAFETGELPHMFLLRVSRGETINEHKPTFTERVDAAKACANYFVPKLQSVAIKEEPEAPAQQLVFNEEVLETLSHDELALFEKVFGKLLGRVNTRADTDRKDKKESGNRFTRTLDLKAE